MQTARVGECVPAFELDCITSDGKQRRIDAKRMRGSWTALVFYPRDFSFICPTEIIAFSSRIEDFRERNCHILGISIDDLPTHARWFKTAIADGGVGPLRYPLAADIDGVVSRRFGVWSERLGLAHRALFLIDPDGVIQFSLVHGPKVGRNVDEVLRVLDALKSGGLCPASWTAADGTLNVEELLKPGRTLGHFRIERELGRGSFGSVVQANDLRLQRQVALKILRKNRGSMTRNQMLNEARARRWSATPMYARCFRWMKSTGCP